MIIYSELGINDWSNIHANLYYMLMKVLLFSILFVLLFSISLSTSYAETWNVSIPGGAANPEVTV
ncbi:hypothetical protein AAA799E16_02065 [Marine Group I thaumarchaeote SCGC AAA799-E16]|uniref:Blue copper domain-containing protein n=4 Tax=Marine Group I TaxID=905826 RepID=A0A081RMS9_9ARCH|nr:hypothetical protein AAA799N04_00994 [Marine Group I thaumarchaeote SCGC AAA799-N04]KER05299.1 hypothetical protein AAA799E16_02065 [Marine Group I thaumarchaeote SCGC AAA799-E16]KFM15641.1 hypothetical protein AAA799D11_01160 [Marine Group I thaumarchaeote SCGC AAA799-D11]KFM16756.1 hypothetical protein SCCGRSA3_02073 [Marine Group I thaumarchaeote SCGC RSA3]